MDKFGVPCPQCGSVKVVVSDRADRPETTGFVGLNGKPHIPQLHRCSCENCRHTFQHDFSFGN